MEWPEPDAVVIRDVFPAVVRFGPSTLRNARAIVTRQRVYVWTRPTAPAVALPYDPAASTIPPLNAPASRPAHLVIAATGNTMEVAEVQHLTVEGQRGCGCGNPLKGWVPWRPYRKATA